MYQWLVCDKFTNVSMKTVEYNLQMYQWKLWNTIYKCINEVCDKFTNVSMKKWLNLQRYQWLVCDKFTNVSMKTVEYNLQMYQWKNI